MSLVTRKLAGGRWFVRENTATTQGSASRSTQVDSLRLSEDISHFISSISQHPVHTSGGFGDVYVGKHRKVGKVALKSPRNTADLDAAVIDRFLREAETWRRLKHPHVLPFVGIGRVNGQLYIVSPYIDNGTLAEYIKTHPDVDRPRLLHETCDAVTYLHRSNVIHGDIKANNILLSNDIRALLCDFGLAKTAQSVTSTAMKGAGNARWQAPEMWDDAPRSYKSDAYSFGMTIIEVLTGSPPFAEFRDANAIMKAVVVDHKRPLRPTFTPPASLSYNYLWNVAEMCCARDASERLDMDVCLPLLEQMTGYLRNGITRGETAELIPAIDLRMQLEAERTALPSKRGPDHDSETPLFRSSSPSGSTRSSKPTNPISSGDTLGAPFSSSGTPSELDDLATVLVAFPDAAPAIETLRMIYLSIPKLSNHQGKCLRLADQAKHIFHLIRERVDADDTKLKEVIEITNGQLKNINNDVLKWCGYGRWSLTGFLNREEAVAAVGAHAKSLEEVIRMLKSLEYRRLQVKDVLRHEMLPPIPPKADSVMMNQLIPESHQDGGWETHLSPVEGALHILSQGAGLPPSPAGPIIKLMADAGLVITRMLHGMGDNRNEAVALGRSIGTLVQTVGRFFERVEGEPGESCDAETTEQLQSFLHAMNAVKTDLVELQAQGRSQQGDSHEANDGNFMKWNALIFETFAMVQPQLSLSSIRLLTKMSASDALRERDRLIGLLGDGDIGATEKAASPADLMCLPGTRTAILDQVDRWVADPVGSRVLWISGVAGCGKSAVAATIAGRPRSIPTSVAVFYFTRGSQERNKQVICSLSQQLARFGDGSLEHFILGGVKSNPDIATSHLTTQFDTLIVNPLKKLAHGSQPVILVLDALDEWGNHSAISRLVELIGAAHAELPSTVRFVLTSRNEPHLVRSLDSSSMRPLVMRCALDSVLKSDAGRDIRSYVVKRFSKLRATSKNPSTDSKWPDEVSIDSLVMLTDGLFQWASTAMSYIEAKRSQSRLREILENPEDYRGLDNLYQGVLDMSFHGERDGRVPGLLQDVLGLILSASVPIDAVTIAYLCCDDIEMMGETMELIQEVILPGLASMFIIPKDPTQQIKVSHKSVVYFLTDKNRCTNPTFYIDSEVHQTRIALSCFRLMARDIGDPTMINMEKWEEGTKQVPAALQYACLHWATHVTYVSGDATHQICGRLAHFSQHCLPQWFKVLSLIEMTNQALPIVQTAHSWLEKHPSDINPRNLVDDVQRLL